MFNNSKVKKQLPDFTQFQECADAGHTIIPLNGKKPLDRNWTNRQYDNNQTLERIKRFNLNAGLRIPEDVYVFDIDLVDAQGNHGSDSYLNLCLDAGFDDCDFHRVRTGSGGCHVIGTIPPGLPTITNLGAKGYGGVQVRRKGNQIVVPGSVHPVTSKLYRWENDSPGWDTPFRPFPQCVLHLIAAPPKVAAELLEGGVYSAEEIALLLSELNPEEFRDYDKWLALGMAVYHASGGAALAEWLEWCARDQLYDNEDARAENEAKWETFDGEGVTFKTLEWYVREATGPGVLAQIDFANSPIDWNEPKDKTSELDSWQWIADSMQFIHDDGSQRFNDRQFTMLYNHLVPGQNLITALERGKMRIRKFRAQVYIPKAPPIFNYGGREVFNIWRPSAMAPKAGDHQWFLDHVDMLFPNKTARQYLLDYMAQLVQHPEVKIHFALLLQSIEGTGKGALARILRRIIGDRNCVEPSNDEVVKAWTGWQEGAQLAIINELMAQGRTDVLNRLKSPITEDTLRIEKKFGNAFTIPNHMNLFCMTNFKDALPIKEGDRRWLILFSPAEKQPAAYYERLFANIADDEKVAAVMAYLLKHRITFNPKAPAPWTQAKADMQERAKSDMAADLQSQYEQQQWPFSFPLLRVADVVTTIRDGRKHAPNAYKEAYAFLDHIEAVKLRRYKHGKDGLAPVQLYAIRDQAKWSAAEPVDAARAYRAQQLEEDEF